MAAEFELAGLELEPARLLRPRSLWGLGLTGAVVLVTTPGGRHVIRNLAVRTVAAGMALRDQFGQIGHEWREIVAEARKQRETDLAAEPFENDSEPAP